MTLTERLLQLSRCWAAHSDRSLPRLATIVANDGKLFERLEQPGKTCTITTFESFLRFFRDAANWAGRTIPDDAAEMLAEIETIGLPPSASPGKPDELTATPAGAAA